MTPTTPTIISTDTPLVSRRTWQIVLGVAGLLVALLIILWLIRLGKKAFAPDSGTSRPTTRPDGTPTLPNTVDVSYIERIVLLLMEINSTEDFGWYSSKRCEAANNLMGMRTEELAAVSATLRQKKNIGLGALVGRWKDDGCSFIGLSGNIDELKSKTRNY